MKKQYILIVSVCTAVILIASSAMAWRSVRTGQKNFERAWSALHFKRQDKALEYFAKAADAFGQALEEQPPSRTTMFVSNLTMAGMSLYYAGRYPDCIKAMGKAVYKDDRIWEGYLYTGLSQAATGDKQGAIASFKAYLKSSPSQPTLSAQVEKQLTELETGSGSLDSAVGAINNAAVEQFQNNVFLHRPSTEEEKCNSRFWWRYNRAPCSEDKLKTWN